MNTKDNKHDISDREMCEAIDYDLNVHLDVHEGKYYTVIGQGFDSGSSINAMRQFVKRVDESDDDGFEVIKDQSGVKAIRQPLGMYYEQLSRWMDTLYLLCPDAFNDQPLGYKHHQKLKLGPEIQALLDALIKLELQKKTFRNPLDSDVPGLTDAEVFKALILCIRQITRSADYKKSLNAKKNNAKRNQKSCVRYFNALLKRWSRLLVLRLDVYFPYLPAEPISPMDAHKARKRFLNNIRNNKLFSDLLGIIWKLEFGFTRGLHFHFIVIYDGRARQKEAWIADQIGRYLTSGSYGFETYHNCNRDPNKYKRRGIGMINHYDLDKRQIFEKEVLGYLTKQDQYLMVAPEHGRSIGRKEMPQARISAAGRKRKQVHVAPYAEAMAA